MQHVLLIGLNHNRAPIEVRETVSFSKDQLPAALSQLNEFAKEAVIVSTCNRTEIYTVTDDITETSNLVRSFLAEFHDVSRGEISPYLYELTDTEAVRHVLNVTSGMDSLVLGEPQILGQVRDAYTAAVEARSARIGLSKLFHKALRVGKRARRETDIGRHAMSVSYVCVELVRKELGELRDHSALLVGVGDAGKLACQALAKAGIGQINVTNRTYERAQDLADKLGGVALPFEQLNEAMSQASIIITATGSSMPLPSARQWSNATASRWCSWTSRCPGTSSPRSVAFRASVCSTSMTSRPCRFRTANSARRKPKKSRKSSMSRSLSSPDGGHRCLQRRR